MEVDNIRPIFRTPYVGSPKVFTLATALYCLDPSRTVQSQAEEADINTLVRRFNLTGLIPQNVRVPLLEDFSEGVFDYQSGLDALRSAEESFMKMPADVRKRFGNDPADFVKFCADPRNVEEMRKMGLAVPEKIPDPIPEPMLVRVVGDDGVKP